MKKLFHSVKTEWTKIIWPSKHKVLSETGVVTVISVLLGVLTAVADFLIKSGLNFIFTR